MSRVSPRYTVAAGPERRAMRWCLVLISALLLSPSAADTLLHALTRRATPDPTRAIAHDSRAREARRANDDDQLIAVDERASDETRVEPTPERAAVAAPPAITSVSPQTVATLSIGQPAKLTPFDLRDPALTRSAPRAPPALA